MMFGVKTKESIYDNKIKNIHEELSYALKIAIGNRFIDQFARDCKMTDSNLLTQMVKGKLTELPPRQILRIIAANSQGRITYKYLYDICGYSERDEEEDRCWANFIPERGEIYFVDLGTQYDSEQGSIRPCIIIQNDIGNKFAPTVIVVPLTTKIKKFGATHVLLDQKDGLKETSYVLSEQIRCISKRRLFYNGHPWKITTLSTGKMTEIQSKLQVALGFDVFDENKAFEMAQKINNLKQDVKINKTKEKILLLNEKIKEFKEYCEKYYINYKMIFDKGIELMDSQEAILA